MPDLMFWMGWLALIALAASCGEAE